MEKIKWWFVILLSNKINPNLFLKLRKRTLTLNNPPCTIREKKSNFHTWTKPKKNMGYGVANIVLVSQFLSYPKFLQTEFSKPLSRFSHNQISKSLSPIFEFKTSLLPFGFGKYFTIIFLLSFPLIPLHVSNVATSPSMTTSAMSIVSY